VQVLEAGFNADAPQKIDDFIKTFKPTFPVGVIPSNFVASYSQITPDMRPTVPILFFIDKNYVIRAQYFGGDLEGVADQAKFFREQLDKLLASAPAGKKAKK
jgi:hypothetical protein